MQLIGVYDSPFVRRVAISAKLLAIHLDYRPVSTIRNFEEFAAVNPVVKAPTLITSDGRVLIDSTLIIDLLEELAGPGRTLMPSDRSEKIAALRVIGFALAACEKTVQSVYEQVFRPPEKRHQPWLDRVARQLTAAYEVLEQELTEARSWSVGGSISQPEITAAVAWRFTHGKLPGLISIDRHPNLVALSDRAEALPEFRSTSLP